MTNRNLGRFYTHLAFSEWDGYETGALSQDFQIKVTDPDSNSEVYVFEPSLPGEAWNILVLKYGYAGRKELSPALKSQVELLTKQLGAEIMEADGD